MTLDPLTAKFLKLESYIDKKFDDMLKVMREEFVTKHVFQEAMSHIDYVMGKYRFLDDERFVSNNMVSEVIDRMDNHEVRLKCLENDQSALSLVRDN
jgi:hypothetical protein